MMKHSRRSSKTHVPFSVTSASTLEYDQLATTLADKDEAKVLMEVASFIITSHLIPCYQTKPVIATTA